MREYKVLDSSNAIIGEFEANIIQIIGNNICLCTTELGIPEPRIRYVFPSGCTVIEIKKI